MKLYTVILPEFLACYAMYGEPSGDEDLDSAYDRWLSDEMKTYQTMHLVCVADQSEGFMRYHELNTEGIGSCDCIEFTYHVVDHNKGLE